MNTAGKPRPPRVPGKSAASSIGKIDGPPLIILDVQNIAMRFGHNHKFVCKGIEIAIEYWQGRGNRVLGFLPDYLLHRDKIVEQWKVLQRAEADPSSVDPELL